MSKIGEAVKAGQKHKLHYAWVVLGAAMVLNVVSRADAASFGVFVDPLVKLYGWSRGEVSFAYSLAFLAGLPAVLAMGWLGDRYGVQKPMLVASLVIGIGTVLLGTITQLWQFYIFYGLFVGSLGNAAFNVLLPVVISRWFYRWMGLALGLYWAALGLGPVIFAPLFRWLIDTQGWRWTFFVIGTIVAIVLVLVSLLIRGRPQEKGLAPYGADEKQGALSAQPVSVSPTAGLRWALSRPTVWYLMAVHHLGCVGHAIILAHVVSMATFQGVPGLTAAGVLSVIAGASIFSRFFFAVLTERIGGRLLLTIALIAQSTPILILLWAHEPWVFYLFAVVFGLSYGGEMVGFPIINRQFYGMEAPLNSIYSVEMVGASLGMALGGWLGGVLFDLSGTYTWAILVSVGVGYLGLPFALALPPHRPSTSSGQSPATGPAPPPLQAEAGAAAKT
ncbi:MAG: MFS transporter [Chloroflexota bacterium]|nr:MFS transporter [Chloroflexota bacterium]